MYNNQDIKLIRLWTPMVNFLAQTRKLVIGIINNPEHIVEEAVLVRTKVVVPGFVPFHSITSLSLIPDPPKKEVLSEQSRKFHQIRGEKQQRENRQNILRHLWQQLHWVVSFLCLWCSFTFVALFALGALRYSYIVKADNSPKEITGIIHYHVRFVFFCVVCLTVGHMISQKLPSFKERRSKTAQWS